MMDVSNVCIYFKLKLKYVNAEEEDKELCVRNNSAHEFVYLRFSRRQRICDLSHWDALNAFKCIHSSQKYAKTPFLKCCLQQQQC